MPNPIKDFRNVKKIPQKFNKELASKPLNILGIMDNSWDPQESPLQKSDWLLENKSLPSK